MTSRQGGAALATPLFAVAGPVGVTGLRLVFSAMILLVTVRPRRPGGPAVALGILCYGALLAGMNLAFYQALARIPLGVTVAVEFLGPLLVAILGSRRPLDVLWAGLAGAGVLLLTWTGGPGSAVGVGFALLAAACWFGYIRVGSALSRRTGDGSALAWAMLVAAVLTSPLLVFGGAPAMLAPELLVAGAGLAVLSSVVPYSLEFGVMRRLPPRAFGVLMSLEPALGALLGYLVLGQSLGLGELVAIGFVVAACVGATRS